MFPFNRLRVSRTKYRIRPRKDSRRASLQFEALENRLALAAPFQPIGSAFPSIGYDTHGAEVILTIGPGGNVSVSAPSGQGPYDGIEDTYFGVVNLPNSGVILNGLKVNGSFIFGFDADGIAPNP